MQPIRMRMQMTWIAVGISIALLAGCSQSAAPARKPDYATVGVFFATDRNQTGKTNLDEMFGADRANLTYGTLVLRPGRPVLGVQAMKPQVRLRSSMFWRAPFKWS